MATQKLTPEQKAAAKALRLQADADARMKAEFEYEAAKEKFKAELPKRLMDAQALAVSIWVATHLELTESGPSVRFEYEDHGNKVYIDTTLTYNSEEWEVASLESDLNTVKLAKEEDARKLACAKSAWETLTDDQQACLKKYIHYLK
jgi:KaiC/GvpD/RAD55 family RecA-like ATPase